MNASRRTRRSLPSFVTGRGKPGERRAIEAHTALGYLEARRLLEAHAREFPRGPFAAEREALLRQIR
ncbi:hypothetical protein [Sorangium sp. So ce388]|uniref:hypothetical protein n=1 Tax=Sorangium sp. So ce388 TaxID=3133309 RepID=UPI003F5B23F6